MKLKKTKTTESPPAPRQPQPQAAVPAYEHIAARAYDIYERSGYLNSKDEANWLEAEAELVKESLLGRHSGEL